MYKGGHKRISKYKTLEWEVYNTTLYLELHKTFHFDRCGISTYMNLCGLFGWDCHWTRKQDHAGIRVSITLFGIDFNIELYDTRHWNDTNDCWETYEEE